MDVVTWALLIGTIAAIAYFNFYLNLASGADPEDFRIGPPQLNMTCDCYLNTIILGGILVLGLSTISSIFSSRIELFITGGIAFVIVTLAGILGRKKRYEKWNELNEVIQRAVPRAHLMQGYRSPIDIVFEDDEDNEDDEDSDDHDF